MSVSYSKVEESEEIAKAVFYGAKEFVQVKFNPDAGDEYPFPSDYEYPSCFMPKKYMEIGDRVLNFGVRPDDVWVATFPRSGTTWTMTIVSYLMNGIDLSQKYMDDRQYGLGAAALWGLNDENQNDEEFQLTVKCVDRIMNDRDKMPSPRLVKTHLPAHLLPKAIWSVRPKLIHVIRDDPRDVAVSMFHLWQKIPTLNYKGTKEDYFDAFLDGNVCWGPYFDHIESYEELGERDHVLSLRYEEMLGDTFAAIKRISEFLNYSYSDHQLKQLADHVSFQNMRKQDQDWKMTGATTVSLVRKGKAGGYLDDMSPEYIRKFDEWMKRNKSEKLTDTLGSSSHYKAPRSELSLANGNSKRN